MSEPEAEVHSFKERCECCKDNGYTKKPPVSFPAAIAAEFLIVVPFVCNTCGCVRLILKEKVDAFEARQKKNTDQP
jgi:hypothetical protein